MNSIFVQRFSLYLLLAFSACIDPYDVTFEEKGNYLVVEGSVTTLPGPQVVRLTTTRNIANKGNRYPLSVEKANVVIRSSMGETEYLIEQEPGVYHTSAGFTGQPGQSYQLEIETQEGKRYLSNAQEIVPLPPLKDLSIAYGTSPFVSSYRSNMESEGFFISTLLKDTAAEQFFRVRWEYTYKLTTEGPAPNTCWVEVSPGEFTVLSNEVVGSSGLTQHSLFFLPVRGVMFGEKIKVRATIGSLAAESFTFWKAVYDSRYNQGGIFDPSPRTVPSNVKNEANPDELVLGFFYASDVGTLSRDIVAKDFPGRVDARPSFPAPCDKYPVEDKANILLSEPEYWTQ